jgi:hypothetical protein
MTTELKEIMKKQIDEMTLEEKLKVVKASYDLTNFDEVANVMWTLLTDEDVKTYDMLEDLAYAYMNAKDESFREGMDKACTVLLWHTVAGVCQKVLQEVDE